MLAENFVLLVPFIGAPAASSPQATPGNAMFMQFQASSAQALNPQLEPLAAAQNAAAANATLASPGCGSGRSGHNCGGWKISSCAVVCCSCSPAPSQCRSCWRGFDQV